MNTKITAATETFYDAAVEIAKDDPAILTCDFESFCDVMWPDDEDLKRAEMSREDFRYALQSAWEMVHVDHL